ncbi:MAG: thioester domain-containing protein [Clostridia bacterium]|nr:thioester domain-containing protein [Clostridia bacterium]
MKRFLSLIICLMMMTCAVTAFAETMKTDDLYVLQHGDVDIPGYNYDQKLVYGSPHGNVFTVIIDGQPVDRIDMSHSLLNIVNIPMIKGENDRAASIPTFCLDAATDIFAGYTYRCINLEDSPHFSDDVAKRVRAVMSVSFPAQTNMSALAEKANKWLREQDGDGYRPISNLRESECITAAQTAIWYFTNDITIHMPFIGTDPFRFHSTGMIDNSIINQPWTETTDNNITVLTRYLMSLDGIEATEPLVSEKSFVSTKAVLTPNSTGAYDAKITVRLKAATRSGDTLKLFATRNGDTSASQPVKNGETEYTLTLSNVPGPDAPIELTVEGNQTVHEAVMFLAKDGDSASQSTGALTTITAPVRAKVTIPRASVTVAGDNTDPDAPAVPQTGDATPIMQLLLMLTGSAGALTFLRRKSR